MPNVEAGQEGKELAFKAIEWAFSLLMAGITESSFIFNGKGSE